MRHRALRRRYGHAGLVRAPYSAKNLWHEESGLMLQPHNRGWLVEKRGEFMGSVKKLKSGWTLWPLGHQAAGRFHDACELATRLLDEHTGAS
jgi:hypothetical protein